MRRLFPKLNNLLRSNHADLELDREASAHLTLPENEFQRRGMSSEDARIEARRSYGSIEQAKQLLARSAPSFGCPIQEYPAAGVAQALSPANSPIHRGTSTNRSIEIRALRSILTRSRWYTTSNSLNS